ncbi:MAG: ATP-binding protein [Clostridia bacterium]
MYHNSYLENSDYRYIETEGKFFISILCYKLPKNIYFAKLIGELNNLNNVNISYYINTINKKEVLNIISQNITNNASEIQTIRNNQIDIDVLENYGADVKDIRKKIQVYGEDLYNIDIIITKADTNVEKLNQSILKIETILYSNNAVFKRMNFRQLDGYLSHMPTSSSANNKNNILSSGLAYLLPTITNKLQDSSGIYLGNDINTQNIVTIDFFNKKYKNSNIFIMGSSGSGKSYFIKTLILKSKIFKIHQYIIDSEGEYLELANKLDGAIIDLNDINTKYNIMEFIFEKNLNENFLEVKIDSILNIINSKTTLSITEAHLLKECIKKAYLKFSITEDKKSVYTNELDNVVYIKEIIKTGNKIPTIYDVIEYITDIELKNKLMLLFENELVYFNANTSKKILDIINESKELVVFDVSKIQLDRLGKAMNFVFFMLDKIINHTLNLKRVYIDEVWRFMNSYGGCNCENEIINLYKTIRKKNGSILTSTQDINDLFNKDDGEIGKSILNNSNFKFIFSINYLDDKISKIIKNALESEDSLKILSKGSCLAKIEYTEIYLEVKSMAFEKEIIEGGD